MQAEPAPISTPPETPPRRARPGLAGAITLVLASSVLVYQGYHLGIATELDDTNHLETPLALAVAQQLHDGSSTLYGPYSGAMPLVLIHPPLYYRLAGLLAWPIARLGVDPIASSLYAGRVLSFLGLLITLAAAYRIARLDGAPARAGVWSTLLIAGAPIVGSLPLTVRADMLGVGLQTFGVALALRGLRDVSRSGWRLTLAYLGFGLAFCVKQHDVAAAVVTTLLGLLAWWRGRARIGTLLLALALGALVVLAYYGMEEWLTSGRTSRAVFLLPAEFGRIARASWGHVAMVGGEVAKRSIGLVALVLACLWAGPKRALGGWLDAILWLYLIAETALAGALCLNSTGAFVNYAMPAIVFASLWVGRALDRVVDGPLTFGRLVPLGLALLVLLGRNAQLAFVSALNREEDRANLRTLLDDPRVSARSRSERYFVGQPQHNRRFGNLALAHDEWLYGQFEAVGAAEPREVWLRSALTEGPVRVVILPVDGRRGPGDVSGLARPLPELGYDVVGQVGHYSVWERREAPGPDTPDPGSTSLLRLRPEG